MKINEQNEMDTTRKNVSETKSKKNPLIQQSGFNCSIRQNLNKSNCSLYVQINLGS